MEQAAQAMNYYLRRRHHHGQPDPSYRGVRCEAAEVSDVSTPSTPPMQD